MVYPGSEETFLSPLPVRNLSGVGSVAEKALKGYGIRTLGEMSRADESVLRRIFRKNAEMMRDRARGRDSSIIEADEGVKSVSHEVTFRPISRTERISKPQCAPSPRKSADD